MRRLLATAAGGAVLLLGTGCSNDPATTATAPTAVAPASAAPNGAASNGTAPAGTALATSVGGGPVRNPATPADGAAAGMSARARSVGEAGKAANTNGICTQAAEISGTAAATFAADLKTIIEASSANDKARLAKAEEKAHRDVQNWSFALTSMSKLAAEPAVKKALADMGRSVAKLKGDVANVDPAKLDGLRTKLDKACGKA